MNTCIGQLQAASPLPRLEARLLLMHATGLSRTRIMAFPETELEPAALQCFLELQARRVAGEPIAYLLGEREFYGRSFRVNRAVLIPRPDTELLVDAALQQLRGVAQPRILDLGTGSGIVAITLALELPAAEVWALDISVDALEVARTNAALLGARVNFLHSDWCSALPSGMQFDALVSNPPYIDQADEHLQQGDLRFEPASALTDFGDGLTCLRVIYGAARCWLKPGGWVLAEHGYQQGAACRALCQEHGLLQVHTLPDLAGLDRVSGGQAPAV